MYKHLAMSKSNKVKLLGNFSFITLFFLGIILFISSPSLAADPAPTSGSTTFAGVAEVICSVVLLLVLDVGRGIATLAIIALGVAAMYGKATWTQAVTVATGIGIIFGSLTLAPLLMFSIANLSTSALGCVATLGGMALGAISR